MQHGPSEPALQAMDVIHDRIESPASKLLRSIEPWSSYIVLPLFALANAGVVYLSMCSKGTERLDLWASFWDWYLVSPSVSSTAACARSSFRHCREAGRLFMAPVGRRRRARRNRLHDVALHRGPGLSHRGRLCRRQNRYLSRLVGGRSRGSTDSGREGAKKQGSNYPSPLPAHKWLTADQNCRRV